jgi:tRNA(adenine34) deaminase
MVAAAEIIGKGETSVRREGSITAHSELLMLRNSGDKVIFTAERPLTLYTTLEPCLMCLGAAMQCGVDRLVYGMSCAPDGGARFLDEIVSSGQNAPEIMGGGA